jgi:hypothetical protein
MERATSRRSGSTRSRSNKYSASDSKPTPRRGERSRVWVGGYKRADGTRVKGHYREITQ